jgi:hypothetical protein
MNHCSALPATFNCYFHQTIKPRKPCTTAKNSDFSYLYGSISYLFGYEKNRCFFPDETPCPGILTPHHNRSTIWCPRSTWTLLVSKGSPLPWPRWTKAGFTRCRRPRTCSAPAPSCSQLLPLIVPSCRCGDSSQACPNRRPYRSPWTTGTRPGIMSWPSALPFLQAFVTVTLRALSSVRCGMHWWTALLAAIFTLIFFLTAMLVYCFATLSGGRVWPTSTAFVYQRWRGRRY